MTPLHKVVCLGVAVTAGGLWLWAVAQCDGARSGTPVVDPTSCQDEAAATLHRLALGGVGLSLAAYADVRRSGASVSFPDFAAELAVAALWLAPVWPCVAVLCAAVILLAEEVAERLLRPAHVE